MEGKPVSASQSLLSELALPNDTNGLGTILGGKIMHLVDIAGAVAASRHCRQFVVTASFDHMDFLQPVLVGELITLRSSVNRVFNTSMEVGVKVFAEGMQDVNGPRHVASAYLTFVALDKKRQPFVVPKIIPGTDEEKRRYEQAGKRREYRLAHKAERMQR